MYTPYVRITATPRTTLDALPGKNPFGTLYAAPINGALPQTAPGVGATAVMKYVYYNPTLLTVAPVAAPAPVYWKDESFTTVTPVAAEAMGGTVALPTAIGAANAFMAGWLLPNTTDIAGLVAIGTPTAPAGLNGSGVWIQIGGFLAGAWVTTAGAVGDTIVGPAAAAPWANLAVAVGTAPTTVCLGRQLTLGVALPGGGFSADILVSGLTTFWGS